MDRDSSTLSNQTQIAIGTSIIFMTSANWLLSFAASGYIFTWIGVIPVEYTNLSRLAITFIICRPMYSFMNSGLLILSMIFGSLADLLARRFS